MGLKTKSAAVALALVLLAMLAPGRGSGQPWLSEDDRLLRGDVIISFKEAPGLEIHEVQGEILYEASPDIIWAVITDYKSYASYYADLESSEEIQRNGKVVEVKFTINNLWPSPDFVYTLKFTEDLPKWTIEWAMVDGNLKTLFGSMTLVPLEGDPTKTKAIYKLTRDTGWYLPFYSQDLSNRSMVIERLLALRKAIRERKASIETNGPGTEIKPKWRKALFWWEKGEEQPAEGEEGKPEEGKDTGSETKPEN